MPVGLRSRVPAKMTSCMCTPRSNRADCSPSTHEMASEMFDLPQPFGPTMAAMPSPWKRRSVRSQNDLKPRICSFFSLSKASSFEAAKPVRNPMNTPRSQARLPALAPPQMPPRIDASEQVQSTSEKNGGQDTHYNILGLACGKRSILHWDCSNRTKIHFLGIDYAAGTGTRTGASLE